jgi:hypothetical protein
MSVRGPLTVVATLLSGLIVCLAFAGSAFGVNARAAAATSPPAAGAWKIVANHSQPGLAIKQFDGSFAVAAGKVSKLTGITQRHVNSGCVAGERVTMLGSAPILHFLKPAVPADYYYVGKVNAFANVKLTFQAKGAGKVHKGVGALRIFFPGGTDTRGGFTTYSNLTYESSTAGTCNLEFSIVAG